MARPEPRMQAKTNDFKVEILEFEGKLDPEEFLDWLHIVERVFEYKDVPEDTLWWTNQCAKWVRERKSKIRTTEDEVQA